MSRLTLRLPQTLHVHLADLAESEGVSLNQYIVYALSRQATLAYTLQSVPEESIEQQQAAFTALLQSLGTATFDEIETLMAEREAVEPETGLTPEVMQKLQQRIIEKQQARKPV